MRYNNQMHDRYNPGTDLTCRTTTQVTGKTFATIAGPMVDNLPAITTATPGGAVVGVIKYDQDTDQNVGVARGSSRIVTVTAATAITAGSPVIVGPDGKASAYTTTGEGTPDPVIVGYTIDTAEPGADALVSLNH